LAKCQLRIIPIHKQKNLCEIGFKVDFTEEQFRVIPIALQTLYHKSKSVKLQKVKIEGNLTEN